MLAFVLVSGSLWIILGEFWLIYDCGFHSWGFGDFASRGCCYKRCTCLSECRGALCAIHCRLFHHFRDVVVVLFYRIPLHLVFYHRIAAVVTDGCDILVFFLGHVSESVFMGTCILVLPVSATYFRFLRHLFWEQHGGMLPRWLYLRSGSLQCDGPAAMRLNRPTCRAIQRINVIFQVLVHRW